MLNRAPQNVKNDFYIDVGAWSPNEHSVTRTCSKPGWSGISIEGNPEYFAQFESFHRRDVNLQVAVGKTSSSGRIHLFVDTDLSTFDDKIADHYLEAGWQESALDIALITLDRIWHEHVGSERDVHILKGDVECLELEVLVGNRWATNWNRVAVVEATFLLTRTETHQTWKQILHDMNYVGMYSDGLNRFGVAGEHGGIRRCVQIFARLQCVVCGRSERVSLALDHDIDTDVHALDFLDSHQEVVLLAPWIVMLAATLSIFATAFRYCLSSYARGFFPTRMHELVRLAYVPSVRAMHHGGASRTDFAHIRMFAASAFKFYNRFGWRLW
ncbi:FkbM family methyltransferase [Burkholderia ambifaria]|uniref:FkbM family methyltransferase n=1 Tax=Burkholderia ambifaria TaxID=152480 RepID=UPI001590F015|nr:FkbM family methyltransferase [Burkholderia ambifaria]